MAYSFDKLCSNLIPQGKYKVQVTDLSFRTKPTGEASRDIGVKYTILEGKCAKRVLLDTIFEKTFSFRLKPFLVACGVDTGKEFVTQDELYEYAMKAAKGKNIMIDVVIKVYNGKEYNNISNFYPLPGSTVKADDVVKAMNVNPEVKAEAPKADKPAAAPAPEAEPNVDVVDDDLPF